ncbi:MAG: OmpA family protein [Bacteroidales bacterium]|nr:OmpA family protein [Bacteroidales bacterium]
MKNVRILLILLFCVCATSLSAQSFLDRVARSAKRSAENAVESNVNRKVDKAVDDAFNPSNSPSNEEAEKTSKKKNTDKEDTNSGWTCSSCGTTGNTGKFCMECGAKQPVASNDTWTCSCGATGNKGKFCMECGAKQPVADGDDNAQSTPAAAPQKAEMSWNKFDFVAGDEVIFEDNLAGEQLGEFPSMWDLTAGNVEIAQMDGGNVIALLGGGGGIFPLMKNTDNYLPESYTIEADFYVAEKGKGGWYGFHMKDGKSTVIRIEFWGWSSNDGKLSVSIAAGDKRIEENPPVNLGWNRISISFNKRALKVYINADRIANVPNCPQGKTFFLYRGGDSPKVPSYVKNVRIAKGAVPLYDRMMSDGKFITYGITFDVGKSTIKPESMGEINRIVQLLNENPTLKFSVEGHTDATGNAASNQTLSEARSKAIVDKLVEMGIAADRLTSMGKGQNNPIADNSTDEGRAKNRRVEFVKQ